MMTRFVAQRAPGMLDGTAIIAVGYRVNSYQAAQFRIWATQTLRDERLKQGNTAFGKDYFEDLLERIREIRASERGGERPEHAARTEAPAHCSGTLFQNMFQNTDSTR